ncbi:hypothetical protein ACVU7I_13695, partial [Patulibacter sp. S7RM1-6]
MRAPSPRRPALRVAVVAIVLLVLLVVAVVATSGGDDGPRIVRGAPDADFPLRGDAADDDGMIRAAVDAWRRHDTR